MPNILTDLDWSFKVERKEFILISKLIANINSKQVNSDSGIIEITMEITFFHSDNKLALNNALYIDGLRLEISKLRENSSF